MSRKGLDARVTLEPARVHIDLNLGFLMTPFADSDQDPAITKKLTAILLPPPDVTARRLPGSTGARGSASRSSARPRLSARAPRSRCARW